MMADRLALTRTTGSSVPARPRAAVPAFLNKLYSMVNDTQTDELIRWAEDGESFFVPNHERLGREVLPRFFKHGNFASFVRQLNMYGFHKVPQLQQGVLKNETETELWQFSEPHFQRDRPDMLDQIQRKKGPGAAGSAQIDVNGQTTDTSSAHMATGTAIDGLSPSSGPLALHSIAGELSVIKLHQSSISAELQALQESNNQLWQETIAAQERHKKQQDTIERILKFLAGVFGSASSGANASRQSEGRDRSATPNQAQRHKGRLLIGDGMMRDKSTLSKAFVEESVSPSLLDTDRFTEATAPYDSPVVDVVTPGSDDVEEKPEVAKEVRPTTQRSNSQVARRTPSLPYNMYNRSPSPRSEASDSNDDLALRASLASLLNASASPQRLLATLSQMPSYPPSDQSIQPAFSEVSNYNPDDFGVNLNQLADYSHNDFLTGASGNDLLSTSAEPLNLSRYTEPNDPQELFLHPDPNPALSSNTAGLRKAYNSSQDVEADVEDVQMNLEAIMESLGMDPSTFELSSSPNGALGNRFDSITDVRNDPGTSATDAGGGTLGIGLGGDDQSMDIETLINHFNTATENAFDSSQFERPDPQAMEQTATMAEARDGDGISSADIPLAGVNLRRTESPKVKLEPSSPRKDSPPKRNSDNFASLGLVQEPDLTGVRDGPPPQKKPRMKRKRA